jgi:predicted component of type VI protein secretion system
MRFLFERLTNHAPLEYGAPDRGALANAVTSQIQRIVATRPRAPGDPNDLLAFGMLSAVDVSGNGTTALQRYAARLAQMIERFEPRLANVEIALVPGRNPLMPARLRVSGVLRNGVDAGGPQSLSVVLDTAAGVESVEQP